jgi:hypothetical protein
MNMEIAFSPGITVCPKCGSKLVLYKTERRIVKSTGCTFTAVHRPMMCRHDRTVFRSERISDIVSPHCTYANEVMIESSIRRYIDGRSSSEIALDLHNGISERHVRNLSNMALDIFPRIHEDNMEKLKSAVHSYILQIDGTTDSEFSMIVVVRDALSDFVLYAERRDSESHNNMRSVLQSVKNRFGDPSGITSDMRSGIISAAMSVFPGIPMRICLMHFLRDLGKDLLLDLHTDLGAMINRTGVKSSLESILRNIPDYDQKTLDQIGNGFSSNREGVEVMCIRRILEKLTGSTGSSGYGFPFSMRHYSFYLACLRSERDLSNLSGRITSGRSGEYISSIMELIQKITGSVSIRDTGRKLGSVNGLFQSLRKAFHIPDRGNLSGEIPYADIQAHEKCSLIMEHLEVYLHAGMPLHMNIAAKTILDRYRKREIMLFANNSDHTMPGTNNGMERFFRKMRRNIRKRTGSSDTGNILSQSGEKTALFQNLGNSRYLQAVFGSADIEAVASVFAAYRKPFRNKGRTRKETIRLVERGMEMITDGTCSDTPYTDELFESANKIRMESQA